jgi:glycosyltransferase involved in cell wall biosynthesis
MIGRASNRPIRVAIDARLVAGESGGVESVLVGLASGLSRLSDAEDEFVFLTFRGHEDWIQPFVSGPVTTRSIDLPREGSRLRRRLMAPGRLTNSVWRRRLQVPDGPPKSDGTIERIGADAVHFMSQAGFRTNVPSIYHPHDLQHLHLPEFFTPSQLAWRDVWYRALCRQAAMVAVASSWTKLDVESKLGLASDKVVVVPFAPPTEALAHRTNPEDVGAAARLGLPVNYVYYPAQTWAHKNHLGLIDALAQLRDRDRLAIPVVFSGGRTEFANVIDARIRVLGLGDQVHWLGFVSSADVQTTYRRATAVVIPSMFEAASAPLWEAFAAGVPAACSDVTSLPAQAGDAALVFPVSSVGSMADAIRRLWLDASLRSRLSEAGRARVSSFTWGRTARLFRAHYRRISGAVLGPEDREQIAAPPGI